MVVFWIVNDVWKYLTSTARVNMFTSRSWQTRLERIDSDAVLWYIFSDIVIRDKKKKKE